MTGSAGARPCAPRPATSGSVDTTPAKPPLPHIPCRCGKNTARFVLAGAREGMEGAR
jgi:hypothetical protein